MFKQLTDELFVAPQLSLEQVDQAFAAGIKSFICNRPDGEAPNQLLSSEIKKHIEEQGGRFTFIPVSGGDFNLDSVNAYKAAVAESEGACLAYCASGMRSTILWALGQVEERSVEEIIDVASKAGYDLSQMLERLR